MTAGDRKRLVITEDDLGASAPPSPPVSTSAFPSTATARDGQPLHSTPGPLPPVEGISTARPQLGGAPSAAPSDFAAFFRTVRGRNLAAATCGMVLGWAVCEVTGFGLWTAHSVLGADAGVGAYTGAVGFFFAVVYGGWEQILAKSWDGLRQWMLRAGVPGFGLAFVAGFVAQVVYHHFLIQILRSITFEELSHLDSNVKFYLTRALAWGLFGLGMGIAVAGTRSKQKLINGVIGGAIGGAVGGVVFHWASFNINSAAIGRLVGLLVVAMAIGIAIGIVEKLRRDAWLQISGGPMAGKELIVYGNAFTFGSSPKCDLTLIKDPSVAPFHAVISTMDEPHGQTRTLDAYQGCTVSVNGAPATRHRLRAGDLIGIGTTAIVYSERAVNG